MDINTKEKKILCIIPARAGSKGVPRKNIREIAGKPLIAYTIESALSLGCLYKTIVSTESEEISQIAESYGALVPFVRPANLALDTSPMLPVLQHAVDFIEKQDHVRIDYSLLLQVTNPLRLKGDIEGCIQKAFETDADSVVSVSKIENVHPLLPRIIEDDLLKPFFPQKKEATRRQDLKPDAYIRSGGIYLTKRDVVIEQNSIYGKVCRPYIIPKERGLGIDDEVDFMVVEQLLLKR